MSSSNTGICATDGPVLVVGGPGSGKTDLLAKRAKWLIEQAHCPPETIAIVTFTREAAQNMRARLSDPERTDTFLEPTRQPRLICTIHSLAWRVARRGPDEARAPTDCVVLSGEQDTLLLEDACRRKQLPLEVASRVADHKRRGATLPPQGDGEGTAAWQEYECLLKLYGAADYDFQLIWGCRELRAQTERGQAWHQLLRHLLVDEYQDINAAQLEFIQGLSTSEEDGVFVVADDDQSLYHFRGASTEYMHRFDQYFRRGRTEFLAGSHRCPPSVLRGAESVLRAYCGNPLGKQPAQSNRPDAKIVVHPVKSRQAEASAVAHLLRSDACQDALVLVPSRDCAVEILSGLEKKGIRCVWGDAEVPAPVQRIGVLAAWAREPRNKLNARMAMQVLAEGLIPTVADREGLLTRVAARLPKLPERWSVGDLFPGDGQCPADKRVSRRAQRLLAAHGSGNRGLRKFLHACVVPVAKSGAAASFADQLLGWLTEPGADPKGIKLLTFRKAKGLEARLVIIVGMDEGVFPDPRAQGEALMEQARLFYVALTRAREQVHLFHALKRSGKVTKAVRKPNGSPDYAQVLGLSPFVKAIPTQYRQQYDAPCLP